MINIEEHLNKKKNYETKNGGFSRVYILPDGKSVIKTPRPFLDSHDGSLDHEWDASARAEIYCKDMLKPIYGKDLSGSPIELAKTEETLAVGDVLIAVKESFVPGSQLTKDLWESLPGSIKHEYSLAIAKFLNEFHQSQLKIIHHDVAEHSPTNFFVSPEDIGDLFGGNLTEEQKRFFTRVAEMYYERDTSGEVIGYIHNDIRRVNTFININDKQVSAGLIDFGNASTGNILTELANTCKIWEMGFSFASHVAHHYNTMEQKHKSVEMNMTKVALFAAMLSLDKGNGTVDLLPKSEIKFYIDALEAFKHDLEQHCPEIKRKTTRKSISIMNHSGC